MIEKMRILFAFICLLSFTQTPSQQVVSVSVRYRIQPQDSSVPFFFRSRMVHPPGGKESGVMLGSLTQSVYQRTLRGDSIRCYNPAYDLFPRFNGIIPLSVISDLQTEDYRQSPDKITDHEDLREGKSVYFRLKDKEVTNGMISIRADGTVITSVDTILVPDRRGKKFIKKPVYDIFEPLEAVPFFAEDWIFDRSNGHFSKQVSYFGYYEHKYKPDWGQYVDIPVFTCSNTPDPTSGLLLIQKNVVSDVAIAWPYHVLQKDTNMMSTDGPDAVNLMSSADNNISEAQRVRFCAAVLSYAYANPLEVFPVRGEKVDSLSAFRSAEDIRSLFERKDTVMIENAMAPGEYFPAVVTTEVLMDQIYALRFYEDWYQDPVNGGIVKKVRGVGLILITDDPQTGETVISDAGIYIRMK